MECGGKEVYCRLECAWSERQGLGELVDGACVHAWRPLQVFCEAWTCTSLVVIIALSDAELR